MIENKQCCIEFEDDTKVKIAPVLSFFIPGLGQISKGEVGKCLMLLFFAVLSMIFAIVGLVAGELGALVAPLAVWLIAIIDANDE